MAKYEVLERSFINGRLCEKGAVVELEIDSPGSNLKPIGLVQTVKHAIASPTGSQGGGAPQPSFTTKHNGGGRHIVVDADGKKVGDFVGGSKEEAQAEADRLNAGGEPYIKPAATTGSQGGGAPNGDSGDPLDDDEGPDA